MMSGYSALLISILLEGALRALVAAIAVWAGLRILRIGNVLAQKAAWSLVLAASLVMPFAPRWHALPAWAALRLPSTGLIPAGKVPASEVPASASAAQIAVEPAASPQPAESPFRPSTSFPAASTHARHNSRTGKLSSHPSPEKISRPSSFKEEHSSLTVPPTPAPQTSTPALQAAAAGAAPYPIAIFAILLYIGIAALLLLRLLAAGFAALRLWIAATPVTTLAIDEISICVRASARISSPVNIGSGILLPEGYTEWDDAKLRIVLAHEYSHIRQGDFYLQLLAGLYASVFWFSPLGWWLKRKLYELGEAISDRAGLEKAASRTSYAQLLLEFAALPRPTLTGVAMARTNHLSQRIERLLDESHFRKAFATGGRRAWLAAVIVPLVLFAASTLVRVEAATPAIQAQAAAATEGVSAPAQVTDQAPAAAAAPAAQAVPEPQAVPAPPPAPDAVTAPSVPPVVALQPGPEPGPGLAAPGVVVVPMAPRAPIIVSPRVPTGLYINPDRLDADSMRLAQSAELAADMIVAQAKQYLYSSYDQTSDGDPYALVDSDGKIVRPRNDFFVFANGPNRESVEKARKMAQGEFLWFQHDGKAYIIDDPSIVAQIEAMNKPAEEIQSQMQALGKQMRDLGEQQRDLGQKMREVAVPTPDLSKEIADLNAAAANLKAKEGGTISQKDLGDLQREIGRIQGQLGQLQSKIGGQQSDLGGQMGKFGGQMGALGGQMGQLGSKMGAIMRENQVKMKGIIADSLSNGKAKPVE